MAQLLMTETTTPTTPASAKWKLYFKTTGLCILEDNGVEYSMVPSNGWTSVSETWTRTGNYTFTVSGNLTAKYKKGTKVRYKDGSGYEYGVILSSVYSSVTTVTLITNSDYSMAAATITDRYISNSESPEGWPDWFEYTPTISATSGSITGYSITTAKFCVSGSVINVLLDFTITNNGTGASILTVTAVATTVSMASGQFKNTTAGHMCSLSAGSGTSTLGIVKYDGTYPVASSQTMRGTYTQDI